MVVRCTTKGETANRDRSGKGTQASYRIADGEFRMDGIFQIQKKKAAENKLSCKYRECTVCRCYKNTAKLLIKLSFRPP